MLTTGLQIYLTKNLSYILLHVKIKKKKVMYKIINHKRNTDICFISYYINNLNNALQYYKRN